MKKRMILVVLDGWGYSEQKEHNAIASANTPFFDTLMKEYPHSLLLASGGAVGLPGEEMGNSEVGHLTIGAGRVLENDVVRISKSLENGELAQNSVVQSLCEHVLRHDSTLHVQGLLSPGGVHSHEEHLFGILKIVKKIGIKKVVLHVFTDGRDTPPQSARESLLKLENLLEELEIGAIATLAGRYYAMDRDQNWDRVERVEKAIFSTDTPMVSGQKPSVYIETLYKNNIWDEHIEPVIFVDETGKSLGVQKNDAMLFFNFRSDRARMLSQKIVEKTATHNLCFATCTQYDPNLSCHVLFPPLFPEATIASVLGMHGITQAHIAETEKYAHATYFLNGKKEISEVGEEHILIESRKDIATHNLAPEMRAKEIVDAAIEQMHQGTEFIFLNLVNADMVGHTADWDATLRAVETIDREVKRLVDEATVCDIPVLITSDHGNAEMLFDLENNCKHTAHTNNPVPCIFTDKNYILESGSLIDVAPTVLSWFGLDTPPSMQGKNLIHEKSNH